MFVWIFVNVFWVDVRELMSLSFINWVVRRGSQMKCRSVNVSSYLEWAGHSSCYVKD